MGTLRGYIDGDREDNRFNFYRPVANSQGKISKRIRFIPSVSQISQEFNDDFTDRKHWGPFGMGAPLSCPRTLGKDEKCLVCEVAESNKNNPELQKIYRAKTSIVSNILVLEDPETNTNVGKVFKYQIPWSIVDKIRAMAVGSMITQGQEIDIYDIETGCDLLLIGENSKQGDKYATSQFSASSPIPLQYREVIKNATLDDMADKSRFADADAQVEFLNKVNKTLTEGNAAHGTTVLNSAQATIGAAPIQPQVSQVQQPAIYQQPISAPVQNEVAYPGAYQQKQPTATMTAPMAAPGPAPIQDIRATLQS